MNRRTVYTVIVIILVFFLFFNPFRRRSQDDVPQPYVANEVLDELSGYLESHHRSPEVYLAELFRDHSLVFLGEFGRVSQQVNVVSRSIPELYERGIRHMGIEFALYEDTPRIDAILTADSYDEDAVHEILFNRMVLWGYQEYADIFRYAWELNSGLPEDSPPFRIVGLNVPIRWDKLENERDMRDPEVIARVYENGVPDIFMAETILEEFVRKDRKALVFTSLQHAFTSFVVEPYAEKAREMELPDDRRAGNIVYDRVGNAAATVLFHSPWPYKRAQALVTRPVEGTFGRLIPVLPEDMRFAGFDTAGTPFGELDAERNDFAEGYDNLVLQDLCDGYIITGPISSYETVTPIPGFIDEDNIDEALLRFPGPNVDPVPVEEMNTYIANVVDSTQKIMDRF